MTPAEKAEITTLAEEGATMTQTVRYGRIDMSDESLALGPGYFWCPDHPFYAFGMKGTGYGPPCPVCGSPTAHHGHYAGGAQQRNTLRLGGAE